MTGTTVDATVQSGEVIPAWLASRYQRSVWWKWNAPSTGWYAASTNGSVADTILVVSTGSAVNALTVVHANDHDMRGNNSTVFSEWIFNTDLPNAVVRFQATAGVEYQMAVASSTTNGAAVRLRVDPSSPGSPRLTTLSFTNPINVSGTPPRGTATLTIDSITPFSRGTLFLYGRNNSYNVRLTTFTSAQRTSGDSLHGTYTVPFDPQTRLSAGTLDWQLILEADDLSEMSSYGLRGQTAVPAGLPASFPIINNNASIIDSTPPAITTCTVTPTPATFDVSTGINTATVDVTATDNDSVQLVFISLIDSSGREYLTSAQSSRVSGDNKNGVYRIVFSFVGGSRLDTFSLRVRCIDFGGNFSPTYNSIASTPPDPVPFPGPFSGTIQVSRSTQVTMNNFTVTPPVVDVTNGPATVTVECETSSGPTQTAAQFFLYLPAAAAPVYNTYIQETALPTENVQQTATGWKTTVTIPKGYPPGLSPMGVQIIHGTQGTSFGERKNYSIPAAFQQGIVVINDGQPDLRAPRVEFLDVAPDPMLRSGCTFDTISALIRFRDDATGPRALDSNIVATVRLRTSNFSTLGFASQVVPADRVSGTLLDGLYRKEIYTDNSSHSALSAGDYLLEIVAVDGVGRTTTVTRTRAFKLQSPPAAYTTWLNAAFPGIVGTCAVRNLWGPNADADQDGLDTATEGYFDLDPVSAREGPGLFTAQNNGPSGISLAWTEPANVHGLTMVPLWSPDLTTWLASGDSVSGIAARTLVTESLGAAPGGGTLKRVTLDMTGSPRGYLRLRPMAAP